MRVKVEAFHTMKKNVTLESWYVRKITRTELNTSLMTSYMAQIEQNTANLRALENVIN
jgi:hypothetical protein